LFDFVTNTRVTDRRTDGQTYDSQDPGSIAASRRAVKQEILAKWYVTFMSCTGKSQAPRWERTDDLHSNGPI